MLQMYLQPFDDLHKHQNRLPFHQVYPWMTNRLLCTLGALYGSSSASSSEEGVPPVSSAALPRCALLAPNGGGSAAASFRYPALPKTEEDSHPVAVAVEDRNRTRTPPPSLLLNMLPYGGRRSRTSTTARACRCRLDSPPLLLPSIRRRRRENRAHRKRVFRLCRPPPCPAVPCSLRTGEGVPPPASATPHCRKQRRTATPSPLPSRTETAPEHRRRHCCSTCCRMEDAGAGRRPPLGLAGAALTLHRCCCRPYVDEGGKTEVHGCRACFLRR
nr:hypothetical protein Itr_chr08CG12580 [Ipomoea trifida]